MFLGSRKALEFLSHARIATSGPTTEDAPLHSTGESYEKPEPEGPGSPHGWTTWLEHATS